ncbi:O-antigen/teichoic acid export membrane protein [Bradyrhizobium sp. GM6.1]
MYIGVLKVGEILFPFFSTLQKESAARKVDLLFRSSWIMNVLAASALGGLISVAHSLLHVWTGAEVAAQAERVLVVLSIAGILGSSANVFGFYLLAQGRSRSNALIALITGVFTLITSAVALPLLGWQAAGWSTCAGMVAQFVIIVFLLRRSFKLADIWSRVVHSVLMPLGIGIGTALALRYGLGASLQLAPSWWSVGAVSSLTGATIFLVAIAASQLSPYRTACRQDLRAIASRFLPLKAG